MISDKCVFTNRVVVLCKISEYLIQRIKQWMHEQCTIPFVASGDVPKHLKMRLACSLGLDLSRYPFWVGLVMTDPKVQSFFVVADLLGSSGR